jgi:multimeric flavodoxin WrbA
MLKSFITIMKILAFNGSPRKQQGMTDRLLDIFLDSAKESGAEVTKHYITDMDINGCIGCFSCWWKTPGKCIHRDDMDWALPAILDSDITVFATPVYHDNIIHYLQRLRERTLPLAMPEFVLREGETKHPGRYKENKTRKTVIVATAGFPESSAFDVTERLFQNDTHIFLPSSVLLVQGKELPIIQDFMEAVKNAADKLVKGEDLDDELKNRLKVDFPPEVKAMLIKQHNEASDNMKA